MAVKNEILLKEKVMRKEKRTYLRYVLQKNHAKTFLA